MSEETLGGAVGAVEKWTANMGKKNLLKALKEVFNPELSPNKGRKLHRRVMVLTDGAVEIHELLAAKQFIKE